MPPLITRCRCALFAEAAFRQLPPLLPALRHSRHYDIAAIADIFSFQLLEAFTLTLLSSRHLLPAGQLSSLSLHTPTYASELIAADDAAADSCMSALRQRCHAITRLAAAMMSLPPLRLFAT
jgi:hypothetical protein